MFLHKVIFTGIFIFAILCSFGQSYNFKHYTVEDGLLHEFVNDIIQDSKGNVWLATGGGLSKFNGFEFTNYTSKYGLNYTRLLALSEDGVGNIWIGSSHGINVFDGNSFLSLKDKSLGDNVLALEKAYGNNMWILTDSGLSIACLIQNKVAFRKFPFHLGERKDVNIFQQRDLNNFVLNTQKNGVYFGFSGHFYHFSNKKLTKINLPDSIKVLSAVELEKDKLILGTNKGLYFYNNLILSPFASKFVGNASITRIKLNNYKVWAIAKWKNEDDAYLVCLKLSNDEYYRKIGKKNGLINSPTSLFIDHENNVWCSSYGGLSVLRGESFISYNRKNGMGVNKVWGLTEDSKHRIWVGSIGDGLSIITNDTSFQNYNLTNGLPDMFVGKIFELNENKMLIATNKHGLCVADYDKSHKNWKFKQLDCAINKGESRVDDMVRDNDSILWVASSKGLFYSNDNKTFIHYPLFADDSGQVFIQKLLFSSKHELWVTTRNYGVYVKRDGKFYSIHPECFKDLFISSICEDCSHRIWVASQTKGIMDISNEPVRWINEQDGLSSNLIYFLQADNHCNLWVGTNLGLDKIILYPYFKHRTLNIRHYDTNDGLQSIEMNLNGSIMDCHDNLWFASNNGLLKYNYSEDIINSVPPILHITDIKLHSKNVNWLNYVDSVTPWYHLPVKLVLSHTQNHLTFQFVGISFKNPGKIQYTWKLDGFDTKWTPPTTGRQAIYSNLSPGNYVFMLKASNNEGLWTTYEITYPFKIIPPFWATWWFRIMVIIVIIILLYYSYQWRTFSLRKQHAELEKQVKERTAEILKQKEKIEEIHHVVNQSIEYATHIQNSILPSADVLKKNFQDYFILFRPRDKVSGDFYWWTKMKYDEIFVLAVADCTGHGVPGAFMSMLGISMLNEIVNKEYISHPAVVLRKLRKDIIKSLKQTTQVGVLKDGMDMSIISINFETLQLQYAGANNPVYIARKRDAESEEHALSESKPSMPSDSEASNKLFATTQSNKYELIELKPDKMPIGIHERMADFTVHTFQLAKDDCIYLFSDGYIDQFGGAKAKKLMHKAFKHLLLDICHKNMVEQGTHLEQSFISWKGKLDQVDDVTIVGIKV